MFLTSIFNYDKKASATSWSVIALGAFVTLAGMLLANSEKIKAGMTGFGLAHLLLGALDLFRLSKRRY
ncbi:MAG: hypothetical protein GXZ07_03715 [Firmicutes bacterium]|nr:hypothetical protein [Bacillota bacterium]